MDRTVAALPPDPTGTATGGERAERAPAARRTRGGRPSRTDALRLGERILDVATELFLTQGYGATSIEAVASRAGISKRTFYHRFDGKAELFAAVVHRIIQRLRPPPEVPLVEGATLHEVLRRLAQFILNAALSPPALALHRVVIAESARFPELVRALTADGGEQEAISLIGQLLAREPRGATLAADARARAAQQFLQMVIAVPQRRALGFGIAMTPPELEAWIEQTVNVFLYGVFQERRTPAQPSR
jgi:TetR/AcrR family transcriptional repressor of mexJK operon